MQLGPTTMAEIAKDSLRSLNKRVRIGDTFCLNNALVFMKYDR